jgi:hypothetical protein
MFKLRPHRGFLFTALSVLLVGGLLVAYLFTENVGRTESGHWLFALLITLIVSLSLVIVAFSRYSFRHLQHHRPGYKRG